MQRLIKQSNQFWIIGLYKFIRMISNLKANSIRSIKNRTLIGRLIMFAYAIKRSLFYKNPRKLGDKVIKILHVGQVNSPHFNSLNNSIKSEFANFGVIQIGYLICSTPDIVLNSTSGDRVYDACNWALFKNIDKNRWFDKLMLDAVNLCGYPQKKFDQVVEDWKPDIIWAHDFQVGGYLLSSSVGMGETKKIITTYGNDLYFFKDNHRHKRKLKEILGIVDFLHLETIRDMEISKSLGYSGKYSPLASATLRTFEAKNGLSAKKYFMLIKGSYRFRSDLNALFSLILKNKQFFCGKRIVVFGATSEDRFHAKRISIQSGARIACIGNVSAKYLYKLMSRSKYHASFTLSDGVANTCAEAVINNSIPLLTEHNGFKELLPDELIEDLIIKLPLDERFVEQLQRLESVQDHNALIEKIYTCSEFKQYISRERKALFFERLIQSLGSDFV